MTKDIKEKVHNRLKELNLNQDQINYVLYKSKFKESEWNKSKLGEIKKAVEKGIDPTPWLDSRWSHLQMMEFRLAAEKGIDTTPLMDEKYSLDQMKEFRLTAEKGIS